MCTYFNHKISEEPIVGKNYDIPSPCFGQVIWNPKGIHKKALLKQPESPLCWRSEFGSITFNQVARDFPSGGMNEKGMIVEQTTLWNTIYPDKDSRPAIKELQLIQYLLDTTKSVEEALSALNQVRVSQSLSNLQYIISDAENNICLIEFILGETLIFRNDDFKFRTISNDMLQTSLDYLYTHKSFGGEKEISKSQFSLDRYVATVEGIYAQDSTSDDYFEILDLTKCDETQWQILYFPTTGKISWKTAKNSIICNLSLNDFALTDRCLLIDLENQSTEHYTTEKNKDLVYMFFRHNPFAKIIKLSDSDLDVLVEYPEQFHNAFSRTT